MVGDILGRFGTDQGTCLRSGTGWGTFGEFWNGSGYPRRCSETGRGPSGRSLTGQENLGEIRYGSGNAREGPGRVGGTSGKSGMCRGTHLKVRDGLETSQ